MAEELNRHRHFYLYAKGHYKRGRTHAEELMNLKVLAAEYCGMLPEHVTDQDVRRILSRLTFQHIRGDHSFSELLEDIGPKSFRNNLFAEQGFPYDYYGVLIQRLLVILSTCKVRDAKGWLSGMNLGEPDFGLLPKRDG